MENNQNPGTGTVTISTIEYNDLRDFQKEIEKGNSVEIYNGYNCEFGTSGYYSPICKYVSTDEAVKNISEENAVLLSKLKELQEINEPNEPREKSIEEIKKMSIWKFLKWRKK